MAGVSFRADTQRWRVIGKLNGKKKWWTFATEREARDFAATMTDPTRPRGRRPRSRAQMVAHLASNFEVADDGCWLWTGKIHSEGYAQASWRVGGRVVAFGHRVVLAVIRDEMPEDMVVDHLCRNRACINPDHLEMVPQRENVMRSPIAPGALNAAKTHCAKGHPYSEENTRTYYGLGGRKSWTRLCKTCEHEAYLRRRDARIGGAA